MCHQQMNLLVAGDFCPQNRVAELFRQGNYDHVLGGIRKLFQDVDYSIANFECPVTKGSENPIIKEGPNLQCDESGIDAIKWLGVNCVTLANNHYRDFGDEGVNNTLNVCKKAGVDIVGGGNNLTDASKVLYKDINGKSLAVINCCEHEYSIATNSSGGSNPLNSIQQYYRIKEAKEKADYILVIVHGGHEHFQLPSPRMQEIYRFFIDAGADVVVNHHQHCFSGYEIYNSKPIFYGLGNFCFDNPRYVDNKWNYGVLLQLTLGKEIEFSLIPYKQCGIEPKVELVKDNNIEQELHKLNNIIADPIKLKREIDSYYQKESKTVGLVFEPLFGGLLTKLQYRKLIPSMVYTKQIKRLYNLLHCESHRDKVIWCLSNKLNSNK